MNIFDDALKILKNKSKIRQLVSDLHAEDLQRIIDRVESVYFEKLEAAQAKQAELAGKEQALAEIKDKLKELGLSVNDLEGISGSEKPKQKRNYKQREKFTFAYETQDGEQRTVYGALAGRKNAELVAFLERTGKNIKDCIVS